MCVCFFFFFFLSFGRQRGSNSIVYIAFISFSLLTRRPTATHPLTHPPRQSILTRGRGCGSSIPGYPNAVPAGGPPDTLQEPRVHAKDDQCGGRSGVFVSVSARGPEEAFDVDFRFSRGKGEG